MVHPHVFREIDRTLERMEKHAPDTLVIVDVPLLFETGLHKAGTQYTLSPVIVVWVPEDIQLERLMARDRIDKFHALAKIQSQLSIDEKKRLADMVIDNGFDRARTKTGTLDVLQNLRAWNNNSVLY